MKSFQNELSESKYEYWMRAWTFQEWATSFDVEISLDIQDDSGAAPPTVQKVKSTIVYAAIMVVNYKLRQGQYALMDLGFSRDGILGLRSQAKEPRTVDEQFKAHLNLMLDSFGSGPRRNATYKADLVCCWATICNISYDYSKEDPFGVALQKIIGALRARGSTVYNFISNELSDQDVDLQFFQYAYAHTQYNATNEGLFAGLPIFTGCADTVIHFGTSVLLVLRMEDESEYADPRPMVSSTRIKGAYTKALIPLDQCDFLIRNTRVERTLKYGNTNYLIALDSIVAALNMLNLATSGKYDDLIFTNVLTQLASLLEGVPSPFLKTRVLVIVAIPLKDDPETDPFHAWAVCSTGLAKPTSEDTLLEQMEGTNAADILAYLAITNQEWGTFLLPVSPQGELNLEFKTPQRPDIVNSGFYRHWKLAIYPWPQIFLEVFTRKVELGKIKLTSNDDAVEHVGENRSLVTDVLKELCKRLEIDRADGSSSARDGRGDLKSLLDIDIGHPELIDQQTEEANKKSPKRITTILRRSRLVVGVGLTVAMGSFTYGFGFASFATSIGQPGFYDYFKLSTTGPDAVYTNHILGAVNALFFFGAAMGALIGGPIADNIGRRYAIMTAAITSIIGGALSAGSVHVAMLIVVRIIQGCGLGALATITPIYLAESSTPSKRGMLTGLHGFFLVAGYNTSAWVGFGCYFSKNLTFQWRGPIALTTLPALILLLGCIWVPESPRWLLMKGRVDEAWINLSRLHHDTSDPNDVATQLEFDQMRRQIEFENSNPTGYWAILSNPSYRKRAFLSSFIQFAANSSGALVINYYSVIIYTQLGLTGFLPLLMYCIYTLIGALGNLGSLLTIDWTGRRFALITGLSGCLVALILETAMIAHSEVYPTNIRSRGVALATFTYFVSSITYVTPGATAIATIGWKYFVVFVCLTAVSILVVAFVFPETKGKSLEELAEIFGDEVVVHLDDLKAGLENKGGLEEEQVEVRINAAEAQTVPQRFASSFRKSSHIGIVDSGTENDILTLITGGASGIGLAVAQALSTSTSDTWSIHLVDLSATAGEKAATSLNATFHLCDVTSYTSIANCFKTIFVTERRLDFVFANAGIAEKGNFYAKHPETGIEPPPRYDLKCVDICLDSVIWTVYLALHYFRLSLLDGGTDRNIVMTASCGGIYPSYYSPTYSAAKHGVVGFMRSVAKHFWFNDRIRVNAICPGVVKTNLLTAKEWENFPEEFFTPVEKIVETVVMLVGRKDDVSVDETRIDGVKADKRGVLWGEAVEISGGRHYFREANKVCDDAMMAVMKATDIEELAK
ncbi:hypothetical protein G7Y89_g6380 [Cudoniella acicularis]|uniref:Major facilitator superfamily (MFS) profile domain-containing protein n=1 Tax=Cudoniella acicularis TaxID=354080 RepID=A0A8H4W325_9HELO|nr:hypothetical protein G7Y89_g6380 [Cudoniella acicularis]